MVELPLAAVRTLETAGAEFGDVRLESRDACSVRMSNGQVETSGGMHRSGWGVRAFVKGAWSYASGTSTKAADLVAVAKQATAIARANAALGVIRTSLRGIPDGRKTYRATYRIEPAGISGEEKVALAAELNPITGAFACEVRNATLIERGELGAHVKFALLTGNFYDGLKKVEGIGRELEPIPVFHGSPGCAYVPPVAFGGFELVGQT